MDDEAQEDGLGGLAWYQLGRMSAETDRVRSEAMDAILKRSRPHADGDVLVSQNNALAAENVQLRQELEAFRHNYAKLRAWAEEASTDLKRYRGQ